MNLWNNEHIFDPYIESEFSGAEVFADSFNIGFSLDIYTIPEENSSLSFSIIEYLSNQFNPFVKENIPPMILGMSVTTHKDVVYDSITLQPMIYTPKQKTAYFPAIFAISSMSQ